MTDDIGILFVAGFGPIAADPAASAALYRDALGLPLEAMPNDGAYLHSEKVDGVKHFAIWPLKRAAQAVFGADSWPSELRTPNAWLEFEVADLAKATAALKSKNYKLLVENRQEPWGQTVTRLLSPEGILVGLTITPWLRDKP
jgi:catechol 2,3-dioxygenase-like lactoylglutathione lyase family enzyme